MESVLVDVPEAARLLSVSQTTVRCLLAHLGSRGGKRASKPRIPSVKVGGCTRIKRADLLAFIEDNTR